MMQAQREAPADMQCKDKFLVQSVIVPEGGLNTEVSQEMVRVGCLGEPGIWDTGGREVVEKLE